MMYEDDDDDAASRARSPLVPILAIVPRCWRSRSASPWCCTSWASSTAAPPTTRRDRRRRPLAGGQRAGDRCRRRPRPTAAAQTDVPKAVVSVAPPAPGRAAGPLDPRRLAGALRHAGRRAERAMRADAVRHRRGPRERRPDGDRAEDRRQARRGSCACWRRSACCCPPASASRSTTTDIGRAGFVRCLPNGCVAEVILEDKLLDQLETGKTATFIIFQTPEEGIGIPISLNGFGRGLRRAALSGAPPAICGSAVGDPICGPTPSPSRPSRQDLP